MIIYLGRLLPDGSSGTSSWEDTALQPGKGLAVSTRVLPQGYPTWGSDALSFVSVSARTSHLAVDGNYPLPCSSPVGEGLFGLSSLYLKQRAIIRHQRKYYTISFILCPDLFKPFFFAKLSNSEIL